jgi:hypothetical protein
MTRRNQCRLQLEELEQRAVPAGLTGKHAFVDAFTGMLTSVNFLQGGLPSGNGQVTANLTLGKGFFKGATVSFSGGVTSEPSINVFDVAGTLTIKTKHGLVNTASNAGSVDITNLKSTGSGTFMDTGTISGGTGQYKGVTGNFTINGTFSALTESATGTLTGTISGHRKHRH